MTTTATIAQLADALDAARASGRLAGFTEVCVDFRLPRDEWDALDVEADAYDDDDVPVLSKTVYDSQGEDHHFQIVAGIET